MMCNFVHVRRVEHCHDPHDNDCAAAVIEDEEDLEEDEVGSARPSRNWKRSTDRDGRPADRSRAATVSGVLSLAVWSTEPSRTPTRGAAMHRSQQVCATTSNHRGEGNRLSRGHATEDSSLKSCHGQRSAESSGLVDGTFAGLRHVGLPCTAPSQVCATTSNHRGEGNRLHEDTPRRTHEEDLEEDEVGSARPSRNWKRSTDRDGRPADRSRAATVSGVLSLAVWSTEPSPDSDTWGCYAPLPAKSALRPPTIEAKATAFTGTRHGGLVSEIHLMCL
ncbi:hypothetical protein HPB47_003146 [Ixodes persulcatus]|uniref:Uncharacterized protein n=1 Tax=Ixodes persulcatus TaxID=34615 RepID=A0AC60PK77_IXOPE|nr:hypothetical protein HPB47_003146 [Ixodes persulcatus]